MVRKIKYRAGRKKKERIIKIKQREAEALTRVQTQAFQVSLSSNISKRILPKIKTIEPGIFFKDGKVGRFTTKSDKDTVSSNGIPMIDLTEDDETSPISEETISLDEIGNIETVPSSEFTISYSPVHETNEIYKRNINDFFSRLERGATFLPSIDN